MKRLRLRGPALGCLVVLGAVILCGGITFFAADRICYGNLSRRLPIYPNATVTSRTHNLFTEFGMGNTVVVLDSPDPPDNVRSWYAVETGSYVRESLRNNTPFFRMAQGSATINSNGSGGSQIILYGTCVN